MRLIFFFTFISWYSLIAQNNAFDFSNFNSIESIGHIPSNFLKLTKSDNLKQKDDDRYTSKIKEEFSIKNNYSLRKILLSGRVVYGDPVTMYINKVANELLQNQPDLKKELVFYTNRSSSPNAFSTSNGVILVNIGLIARLRTESELAYILAHEIAHYKQQHSYNSFVERNEIMKGKERSRQSLDDKIELILKRSKQNEFEADSLGLLQFLTSNYNIEAPLSTLEILGFSHLPYRESEFDKTLFNVDHLKIPNNFFKNEISKISNIEAYNDDNHTHPNIVSRKKKITDMIAYQSEKTTGKNHFIVSENEFRKIRKIARFDLVGLDLLRRNYGSCIYNSFLLLNEFPNNKYLQVSIAKALYGLTKYKNADEYHRVANSFSKIDGESQQIHYFLRQLTAVQLNVVTYKYIESVHRKYQNDTLLTQLMSDILKELVIINEVSESDFYKHEPNSYEDSDFYKLAFINELKNDTFTSEFQSYYQELEDKRKLERLTYKEKQRQLNKKRKYLEANGLNIFVKKVIIIDPDFYMDIKKKDDYNTLEAKRMKLNDILRESAQSSNLEISMINSSDNYLNETRTYNDFCKFKLIFQEMYAHGEISFIPLFSDHLIQESEFYDTSFAFYLKVYNNKYYNSVLYNMKTGRIVYVNLIEANSFSEKTIKNTIIKDFSLIKR